MKSRLITPNILIFFSILYFFLSCNKRDFASLHKERYLSDAELVNRFFNNSTSPDTDVRKVAQKIKDNYQYSPKLVSFIRRFGVAVWDKAVVTPLKSNFSGRPDGAGVESKQVLLPLFPLDSSFVQAALLCNVTGDSIWINLLDGHSYRQYAQDGTGVMSAHDLTMTLIMLDNKVQGNTLFEINDSVALKGGNQAVKRIKLASEQQQTNLLSRSYMLIQLCWFELVPNNEGQLGGVSPGENYQHYIEELVCRNIIAVIEDGGGGSGSCCDGAQTWIDPTPPPAGSGPGTGWQPISEPLPDPGFRLPANFHGNSNYITPAGVAVTLPAGAKIVVFGNIDVLKVYPNGALTAFEYNGQTYVSVQSQYIESGRMDIPPAAFTGYYLYENGQIKRNMPLPPGILTQTVAPRTGNIQAVRMKVESTEEGCKLIREKVNVTTPAPSSSNIYNTAAPADFSVEYFPIASTEKETSILSVCPGAALPGGTNSTVASYVNSLDPNGENVVNLLKNGIKSDVKIYLVDKSDGKVKHVISNSGVQSVYRNDQTALVDKFNNNGFTASDEEIAIKAEIENGQWKYEVKLNAQRINLQTVHPKAALPGVMEHLTQEIHYQTEQAIHNIRGVGRSTQAEVIPVENGEQFSKRKMDLLATVAACWDAGKTIMKDGALPAYTWDNGSRSATNDIEAKQKYDNSAFQIASMFAGCTDQFIEETTGIIQLTKTALEAFRRPTETFNNIYGSIKSLNYEKLRQMALSATGVDNYQAGGARARYQGGRHGVQLSMSVLGPVKILNQGKQILREGGAGISNVQKFIPDGTVGHPSAVALKNAAEHKHNVVNIRDEKLLTKNRVDNEDVYVAIEKKGAGSEVYEARKTDFVDENGSLMPDQAIQDAIEDGAKDIPYPQDTDDLFQKGRKGAWNKSLNQYPLIANKIYDLDGCKYHTDAQGRVMKVEIGTLQKYSPPADRNQYQQSLKANAAKNGVQGQDQGGHLIGSQFGGAGEQINLVPMKKTLNQHPGTWAQMEQEWANALNGNGTVSNIKIDIIYGSNGRPTGFNVEAYVNGVKEDYIHTN